MVCWFNIGRNIYFYFININRSLRFDYYSMKHNYYNYVFIFYKMILAYTTESLVKVNNYRYIFICLLLCNYYYTYIIISSQD